MKRTNCLLFLCLVFVINIKSFTQTPTVKGIKFKNLKEEPSSLEVPNKAAIYWNGTKFRKWDGTTWSDLIQVGSGGIGSFQQTTDVGNVTTNNIITQLIQSINQRANGDARLILGDYDNSSNGTKIDIQIEDQIVELFPNRFGSKATFSNAFFTFRVNQIHFQNPASGFSGIFNTNVLTENQNYDLPNKPGTIALLDDINDPIPEAGNKFIITQDNITPFLENGYFVMNFQNFTDVINVGSIAHFDGSDLLITASDKDVEITALVQTIGEMDLSQNYYFRSTNDPINVVFGDNHNSNGVSTKGIYGKGSKNTQAKAIVKAGTTIALNLVYRNSLFKQRIKKGSYIYIKEIN